MRLKYMLAVCGILRELCALVDTLSLFFVEPSSFTPCGAWPSKLDAG